VTINIPPLSDFLTNEDRSLNETQAKLDTQDKMNDAKIAAINAEPPPSANEPLDLQISDLANGITAQQPKSKDDRITELKYRKRDINEAKDSVARKQKAGLGNAARRLADHLKLPVKAHEKKMVDAMVLAYELHLEYFWPKRHLINNGIGTYGNFQSNIDDVLGIPTDKNSPLATFFHQAVKDGHLKAMPKGFQ
jgi:hypothetical protein